MNKVILMGRLTKDPELRYTTGNNTAVASFTLAVPRRKKEEQPDFIPIVAWDKSAEFCVKWFNKGQQVAIVGHLQVRTWDDNEGKKRYTTEVVAEECHFAEGKKTETSSNNSAGSTQLMPPIDEEDELPF